MAQGLALGGGLIIAIGAQNVFVLRQGLIGKHVLSVVLFCSLVDVVLVTLGAIGLGTAVRESEMALRIIAFGGAIFLFWYGLKAFLRALSPSALEAGQGGATSQRHALATVAALTLLNPHVYLDTVILAGGISASYPPDQQVWFVIGVIAASFAWFFTLGYGGRALAPLFRNSRAWQAFDIGIGIIMWMLAASLAMLGLSPDAAL